MSTDPATQRPPLSGIMPMLAFLILAAAVVAIAVVAITVKPSANTLQVRDCTAAVRFAAKRGPVTTKPTLCEPLSPEQYRKAWSDGTRTQRARTTP